VPCGGEQARVSITALRQMRTRQFKKLIADTKVAIEQGDVLRARQLLARCPPGHERVAAQSLFNYSSPLGRKEPADLLLELYDRARLAGASLIHAYAQPPVELEQIGRHAAPPDSGASKSPGNRHA
jgi:hypothetical protein